MFIAAAAERHRGRVIGNGHCVALVREAGGVPHTSQWRRGPKARGGSLAAGTVIATFGGDPPRYQNRTDGTSHAAVFAAEEAGGLRVWDQWAGQPVHSRLIRFRGGQGRPVNDGDAFHVVTVETAEA